MEMQDYSMVQRQSGFHRTELHFIDRGFDLLFHGTHIILLSQLWVLSSLSIYFTSYGEVCFTPCGIRSAKSTLLLSGEKSSESRYPKAQAHLQGFTSLALIGTVKPYGT